MKKTMILSFLLVTNYCGYCQSDSIGRYMAIDPLFQLVDSVAKSLEQHGQIPDLVFYESGRASGDGLILWRAGDRFHGTHFSREGNKVVWTTIDSRKIQKVLSSRLFSDSCDLCELFRGEKKADIDHEYTLYLKRHTGSSCNELYFSSSALLFYERDNCIWDIRDIIAL